MYMGSTVVQSYRKDEYSFREFALRLGSEDQLVQEFVSYATANGLPRLSSWAEVRTHLNSVGADQGTFIGARLAWREYALAGRPTKRKAYFPK
jgi:hypothetical protein